MGFSQGRPRVPRCLTRRLPIDPCCHVSSSGCVQITKPPTNLNSTYISAINCIVDQGTGNIERPWLASTVINSTTMNSHSGEGETCFVLFVVGSVTGGPPAVLRNLQRWISPALKQPGRVVALWTKYRLAGRERQYHGGVLAEGVVRQTTDMTDSTPMCIFGPGNRSELMVFLLRTSSCICNHHSSPQLSSSIGSSRPMASNTSLLHLHCAQWREPHPN